MLVEREKLIVEMQRGEISEKKEEVRKTSEESSKKDTTQSKHVSKRNQNQLVVGNMENPMREYATPKILVFHGTRRDDVGQHWFTCEEIWGVKYTLEIHAKIA